MSNLHGKFGGQLGAKNLYNVSGGGGTGGGGLGECIDSKCERFISTIDDDTRMQGEAVMFTQKDSIGDIDTESGIHVADGKLVLKAQGPAIKVSMDVADGLLAEEEGEDLLIQRNLTVSMDDTPLVIIRNNKTIFSTATNSRVLDLNANQIVSDLIYTIPPWLTATNYVGDDVINDAGINYRAFIVHTSSVANKPPNIAFWDPLTDAQSRLTNITTGPVTTTFNEVTMRGNIPNIGNIKTLTLSKAKIVMGSNDVICGGEGNTDDKSLSISAGGTALVEKYDSDGEEVGAELVFQHYSFKSQPQDPLNLNNPNPNPNLADRLLLTKEGGTDGIYPVARVEQELRDNSFPFSSLTDNVLKTNPHLTLDTNDDTVGATKFRVNANTTLADGESIDIKYNLTAANDDEASIRFDKVTATNYAFQVTNRIATDAFSEIAKINIDHNNHINRAIPFYDLTTDEFVMENGFEYNVVNNTLTADNIRALNSGGTDGAPQRRVLVDPANLGHPAFFPPPVGAILSVSAHTGIGEEDFEYRWLNAASSRTALAITAHTGIGEEDFEFRWVKTDGAPPSSDDSESDHSGSGDSGGGGGGGGGPLFPPGGGPPGGDSDSDPDEPPDDDPDGPDPPGNNPPNNPPFLPIGVGGNITNLVDMTTELPSNGYCVQFVSRPAVRAIRLFTRLSDTPSSYTSDAGKIVIVKDTEDGLEFRDIIILADGTLANPAITFKGSTNGTGIRLLSAGGDISFVDNALSFLDVGPTSAKYEGTDWRFVNNVHVGKFLTIGNEGASSHYILPDNRPALETSDYILVYQANTNVVDWELKSVVAPTSFLSLTDTPLLYAPTDANRYVAVNSTPDALVFVEPKWDAMIDVENFSAPAANLPARLNATNDGIIFKANTYIESSDTPNNYTDDFAESLDNGTTDLYRGKLVGLNDAGDGFVYRKVAMESAVITRGFLGGDMTANTWVRRPIGNVTTPPGNLKNEYCGAVIGNDNANEGISIQRPGSFFIQGFAFGYKCGEFALRIIRLSDSAVVVPTSSSFYAPLTADGNTLASTMPYHISLTSSQVPETYQLEAICTDTRNGDGWGKITPPAWGVTEYQQWVHCYRFSNYTGQNAAFDT